MKKEFFYAFVLFVPLMARAQDPPILQAPQVGPGMIDGELYHNDSLGVRFAVPTGWTASLPSAETSSIDSRHPGSSLNKCSQRLVTFETRGSKGNGYPSSSILLAINPKCFPTATLPTANDPTAVRAFASELVAIFHGTVYLPPSGVDIDAQHKSKHQFVYLDGSGYRDVESGTEGKKVHVNSRISVTESSGYWVAWVSLVDDAAKKQLQQSNVQFKED